MGESKSRSGTRIIEPGRAIRDAVSRVLPADVAGQVVERALATASTAIVPSTSEGLRAFALDHLIPSCSRIAGPEPAAELLALLDATILQFAAIDDEIEPRRARR